MGQIKVAVAFVLLALSGLIALQSRRGRPEFWRNINCLPTDPSGGVISGARVKTTTEVTRETFGRMSDGTPIEEYTLINGAIETRIITYGGVVVALKAPDRQGKVADVVLGYDSLDGYLANDQYFGAIIGRYANRIAHARFTLDGQEYKLAKNDGDNSLHGGAHGFDTVVWHARSVDNGVELTYVSRDTEEVTRER